MNHPIPKPQRIRLKAQAYRTLHRSVLERDHWRCQACGSMSNLEVHHIRHRSGLGDDADDNLITLCSECHRTIHM
jgi:5-methylcytosine-specific restriction endonuclease McrA